MKNINSKILGFKKWLTLSNEEPLIGILWEPDIPPLPAFLTAVQGKEFVEPDDIQPEMFFPFIDQWHHHESAISSDVIQPYTPAFGFPWMEAICGCPVLAHPGSLWAAPIFEEVGKFSEVKISLNNEWLEKLITFTRELVNFSDGRFPIALPQMRGPLDILAAMLTPQQMCMDLVLSESESVNTLSKLTEVWITVAKVVLEEIPTYHGGYLTRMKMWAPEAAITPQNDTTSLISAPMYRKLVMPFDQQIISSFPYHSYHMHATEYHIIAPLSEIDDLSAIQFTLEHTLGGPSLEKVMPVIQKCLKKKPIILTALDIESAEICLDVLNPEGLCVMVAENTMEINPILIDWCERRTG